MKKLKTHEAIAEMTREPGPSAVSLALGQTRSYVAVIISRRRDTAAGVLAKIASACGYVLALVPEGDDLPAGSIEIEPRDSPHPAEHSE